MHRIVVCLFWLSEFIATHAPISEEVEALPGSDKHLHFGAYIVLSGLLMFWNGVGAAATGRRVLTVILILAVYAAVDELLQPIFDRDAELLDWAADVFGSAIGATLGSVIANGVSRWRSAETHQREARARDSS
jgi:VanZ family protein